MARKKVINAPLEGKLDLFGDLKPCAVQMGRKGGIQSGKVRRAKDQAKEKAPRAARKVKSPAKVSTRVAQAVKAHTKDKGKPLKDVEKLTYDEITRLRPGKVGTVAGPKLIQALDRVFGVDTWHKGAKAQMFNGAYYTRDFPYKRIG